MSSSIRSLRNIFLHKPATTTTATATNTSAVVKTFKDKTIQTHLKKFIINSNPTASRVNRLLYNNTVDRLAADGRFTSILDTLNHQKHFPEIKDEHFTARLICFYGQAKMLDSALQVFDEMPELNCPRTVTSFNALLSACFPSKNYDKAIELFRELPSKLSIKPDVISYTFAIRALCESRSLDSALSMLNEMEENNVEPNVVTFDTLLGAFYNTGRISEAGDIWSLMEEKKIVPDLRCYNSRLNGFVNAKRLSEATDVFNELMEKGLNPNNFTFNLLLKGFVNEGNLEEVKKWWGVMVGSGYDPDFFAYKIVIPFVCVKDVDFAYEVCKKSLGMKKKVANSIVQKVIGELVEQSRDDEAKELLELVNLKSGSSLESSQE